MESINFMLEFPQALNKTDIYMRPPKVSSGFYIPDCLRFMTVSERLQTVDETIQSQRF